MTATPDADFQQAAMAKLVRMANQIAIAFRLQPHAQAVAGAADHIKSFWTPKMRRDIATHLAEGGDGLEPLAKEAIAKIPVR